MSASAGAIEAGRAFVRIAVDDLGVKQGLNRVSMTLRSWAATTSKIGLALMGAGTAIVAPLVLAGAQAANYGDSLNDATTRTGLLAGEIVGLTHAAELNGTSWESVETGIKKMQVAVNGAREGSKEANDTLAEFGVTVADLAGKSQSQQFALFADRLMKIQDPGQRAAAAVKLFGKAGTDLMPMLAGGAAGLKAMQKEADDLGLTLAGNMATSVGDVDDLISGLLQQFVAFKTVVGVAVASALRPLITWAQPVVATWIRWIAANQGLVKTILWVGAGLVVVGGALLAAGVGATVLLAIVGTLMGAAVALGGALAGAFVFMLSPIGLVIAAIATGAAAFAYLSGYGGQVLGYLGDLWGNLKTTATSAWGGIVDAVSSGDLQLAGEIIWAALKLGFEGVRVAMENAWASASKFMITVGLNSYASILRGWENLTSAIARGALETSAMVQRAWLKMGTAIGDTHATAVDKTTMALIDAQEAAGIIDKKTADAQRAAAKQQADYERKLRKDDADAAVVAVNADEQAQLNQLQSDTDAKIKDINATRDAAIAAIGAGDADKSAALQAELDKKKAELAALVKRAAEEAGKNGNNPASPSGPQNPTSTWMRSIAPPQHSRPKARSVVLQPPRSLAGTLIQSSQRLPAIRSVRTTT